jgi:hypothetical protein
MPAFRRALASSILAALPAIMLAGCDSQMDSIDKGTSSTETFLQITADGAGGLDANTAYSSKAIMAALPGYATGSVLIGLENETTNATVVFRKIMGGQVQVLHVLPGNGGKVGQIHGVTHHVVGPAGERPGMTLAEAGVNPASCRIGANLWLGMAICRSRAAPNVLLTFSFKGEYAMSNRLPSPQVLATGELQRIIWTPPTGA